MHPFETKNHSLCKALFEQHTQLHACLIPNSNGFATFVMLRRQICCVYKTLTAGLHEPPLPPCGGRWHFIVRTISLHDDRLSNLNSL